MPAKDVKTNLMESLEQLTKKMEGIANQPNGWWNHLVSESINWDGDRYNMALTGFFYKAAKEKLKVFEICANSYKFKDRDDTKQDVLATKLTEEFKTLGIPEIYEQKFIIENRKYDMFYSSAETILNVTFTTQREDKLVSISACSFSESIIKSIKEICLKYFDRNFKNDDLFTVSEGQEGLELVSLGRPGTILEKNNYSEEVVKNFEYVIKQFSSKEPFGRLVIIHGQPGTGKTRMLKSFINEIKYEKNKFIFFQPELLSRYNISSITKLLMSAVEDSNAITIFIEDADDVLVSRQSDNMTAISTLLNFADGFIGSLLNLRIIATTNASNNKIDKAIKRAGRLCKMIDISSLTPEHANKVFERISKKPGSFTKEMILADIYAEAHAANGDVELLEKDSSLKSAKVGFGVR